MRPYLLAIMALISLTNCGNQRSSEVEKAIVTINADAMAEYVQALSSDEFMGRKPFTKGEELTIKYLAQQFNKIGLEPAFGDSYFQDVKLVEVFSEMKKPAIVSHGKQDFKLNFPDDIAITSSCLIEKNRISDSEMVFAGFGINAPEYNWNDYKDLDVKGKTVVVFINDPGLYTSDSTLFKGRTMTYYGRWTYKYEEALRQGAKAILIIHETYGAGYPYDIPRKSSLTSNFYIDDPENESNCLAFNGWLSARSSEQIFASLGISVDSLRTEACKQGFKGFQMKTKINLEMTSQWEFNTSTNVAGMIKGSKYPDECIVYSAHWDHFGIGEEENGDSIYNGAVDNGTSLAWMIEIAKAFKSLGESPERSLVFLAPTAEEQGLLGSGWYVEHPVFPIEKTLASINNDLMLPIGRMKDVMVTGYSQSELDDLVARVAEKQDRYIFPDPNPQTGMYFRSDHFSFAKKGVPSLFIRGNCDSRENGKDWAAAKEKEYITQKYHRPADNYIPDEWDLSGIVEDAQMAFEIGYLLTKTTKFPEWREDSEFHALRK